MKYKIEDIQRAALEHDWTLISTEYQNLDGELIFECNEGHRVYTSWRKVRDKWECPVCNSNILKQNNHKVIKKTSNKRRVLALDQSSKITGYSIYDEDQLIDYGIFETNLEDEIHRARQLKEWVISIINSWKPDYIGIEGVQYQQNVGVTTFQTLCRVQGILMELCAELEIPYEICATNTWRHHCGVKGRSRVDKKRSMQHIVKEWYDISVTDDESDAIGIGRYMIDCILPKTNLISWE